MEMHRIECMKKNCQFCIETKDGLLVCIKELVAVDKKGYCISFRQKSKE